MRIGFVEVSPTRRGLRLLAGLCVVAGCVLCPASVALAGVGFSLISTFAPPEGLVLPVGAAVDNSGGGSAGDVYVVDQGTGVLGKFDATGAPLGSAEVPGAGLAGVAVDPYAGGEQGEVLAVGFNTGVLYRFSPGLVSGKSLAGLTEPVAVAVDQAGNVFVAEWAGSAGAGKVLEFDAAGQPINATGTVNFNNAAVEGLNVPQGVAVSANGETLYVATGSGTIQYAIAGASYTPVQTIDGESGMGVALEGSGNVFTDDGSTAAEYEPSGTLVARFGGGALTGAARGIAVSDVTGQMYLPDSGAELIDIFGPGNTPEEPTTGPVGATTGTTALLEGTLSSAGAGTSGYYFAYNTGPSCTGGPTTTPEEATDGTVHTEATGLEPHTTYTFCLIATNKYGSTTGQGVSLQTASIKPIVEGETFSQVGATTATLTAQINTENLPATYHYQYTPEGGTPQTTPEVSLPAANTPTIASAQITGLTPNHQYTFQLTATNTNKETTQAAPVTFNTLPEGITGLPDNRAYEMVTPTTNQNANVHIPLAIQQPVAQGVSTRFTFQVASDGSAVTYLADPTGAGFGQSGRGLGNQYIARRSVNGAWAQSLLQPAGRKNTNYQGFSEDLSVGILNSGNSREPLVPPLTPEAPPEGYSVLYSCYSAERGCGISGPSGQAANPYRPLFRTTPPNRSAIEFRAPQVYSVGKEELVPVFAGGSSEFEVSLFETNDNLLTGIGALERELDENVKTEIKEGRNSNYLYASVDGQLSLVDVSPSGRVVPGSSLGSIPFTNPGHNPADFSGISSADGNRIYWSDSAGIVFVRIDRERTVQVSAGPARYWTSADDGEYAFFTEKGGLYRFNLAREVREPFVAEGASVLGVIGASTDGEGVYFVAEGVLGSGNGEGALPEASQPNLYLMRKGQKPIFIATLSQEDGRQIGPFIHALSVGKGEYGDWQPGLGQRTARVTRNGEAVVFMSNRPLMAVGFSNGYENRGLDEIYIYEENVNRLYCVSCSSSDEAPSTSYETEEGHAAGFLPISWSNTYLPQWISEDGGRVFFDSEEPLVPQDTNGKQDVYEWERAGVGSCSEASAVDGGCVYILSSGTSKSNSWWIGASASGDDVFMVSRAQLTASDGNDAFDLYDARVGGVVPPNPPACAGTGCQGVPAAPPSFATPTSVTFQGVGNFSPPIVSEPKLESRRTQKLTRALKACKRKRRRKRTACERQVKRRYGTKGKAKVTMMARTAAAGGRSHV